MATPLHALPSIALLAVIGCGRTPTQPVCASYWEHADTVYAINGRDSIILAIVPSPECARWRKPDGKRAIILPDSFKGVRMTGKSNWIDPMEGGAERERIVRWKPEKAGAYIIGMIMSFSSRAITVEGEKREITVVQMAPAATAAEKGAGWTAHPQGVEFVLSAALAERLNRTRDIRRVFAIRYDGIEQQESGNEAHLFTVVEQTDARLREILSAATVE